jgi:predicted porin
MKKSLLATTALAALGAVAVAGPAAAQDRISVGVGGYMEQWFGYGDSDPDNDDKRSGFDEKTDAEIHFKGETTLDNGLTVGINVQLEAQTDSDQIDEQYAYIEGSFGRFLMGSENAAPYLMHYGIPSHGATLDSGDSVDWISAGEFTYARTNGRGLDNDSEKITYFTPRFQGFQLGVSYVPEIAQDADGAPDNNNATRDDSFAIGANFNRSFNDFSIKASAGYQDFGDDNGTVGDLESFQFGLQLGFAGFVVAGTYGEEDRAGASYGAGDRALLGVANNQNRVGTQETIGVGLSYASGPFGVSLAYIGAEVDELDDEQHAGELGVKYVLGPGIDVKGSVFYLERETANVDTAKGFAVVGGLDLDF